MQTQKVTRKDLKSLEEQRRKGNLGKQAQEFQQELDMLYETKTPIQRDGKIS